MRADEEKEEDVPTNPMCLPATTKTIFSPARNEKGKKKKPSVPKLHFQATNFFSLSLPTT